MPDFATRPTLATLTGADLDQLIASYTRLIQIRRAAIDVAQRHLVEAQNERRRRIMRKTPVIADAR